MSHAALLRGINVGGKNRVPMKELAAIFESAGAVDVRTYIQSGNVVFAAPAAVVKTLPAAVQKAVKLRFGCEAPVLLRSHDELRKVAAGNPFAGEDAERLMVMFLSGVAKNVAALDTSRSPPDRFVVRGREIYLHCPNGFGRSKLTNDYFERALGVGASGRNWRTLLTLVEMTA